ncbi:MAG: ABC transporter substrate-binding protein [Candidatus Tectomicrobia bacterium]|nr:ABC transporter substrate-binding protein [Candidatus Tectomicrobia bacterium]
MSSGLRRFACTVGIVLSCLCLGVGLLASAAAEGQSREPIKIGLLTPLKGALAQNGTDVSEGVRLYFSEQKSELAGRKIDLIIEDTASDVNTGLTKARKLIERDQVKVIIGPVHSGVAMAIRNLVDDRKIPLVITQATANALTQEKASPYIFRPSFTSAQMHLPLGPYMVKKLGWKRVAVLALDYVAGREQADGFIKSFKEAGGTVALELYPNLGATDMAPYLTRIRSEAEKLDAVVALLWSPTAIHFVKGYQDFGLKGKLPLFAHGATVDESFFPSEGDAALGILSHLFWSRVLDTPENKRVSKLIQQQYNRPMANNHDLGYTAAKVVGEAVKAVKGNVEDQAKFLQALRQVRFEAPRGPFRFDDKQNAVINVYIRRVEKVNGQLENVVIDTIPDVDQFWKPKM